MKIDVIIPAQDEEHSIAKVVQDIPRENVGEIVVVNNGSTDQTARRAAAVGAVVLDEPRKGYGQACLKGMAHLAAKAKPPAVVVFMDGDYADYPEKMTALTQPILNNEVDFTIGARRKSLRETGSMTIPQAFGNWLATFLMRLIYGAKFTDLGPFRAIAYPQLKALQMQDTNYGWTVEMQIKALKHKLRYREIPVPYRRRIGVSKVSGTLKGTVMAGYKIILLILKYSFS